MTNKLAIEDVKEICKIGQGEKCCRYISVGAKGWKCLKHSELKSLFDSRVRNNLMAAQGDNCEGVGGK